LFASKERETVELDIHQRVVISTDRGLQQPPPECYPVLPAGTEVLRTIGDYAVDLQHGHASYCPRNARGHAEDECGRSRQGSPRAPSLHKYLAHEGSRGLLGKQRARRIPVHGAWVFGLQALPPFWNLKIQVYQQYGAATRALADPCIHLSNELLEGVHGRTARPSKRRARRLRELRETALIQEVRGLNER
jgi:hypothetical protein